MQALKDYVKTRFPAVFAILRDLKAQSRRFKSLEHTFTTIYEHGGWGCPESVSGRGSTLAHTAVIRNALPVLIDRLGVKTLLDVPCGDFHWMQYTHVALDKYIGADVVKSLVETNTRRFGNQRRAFVVLDITQDSLPRVDLILCRDLLVHLSFQDISRALEGITKSGARYLLATTFTAHEVNSNVISGDWRPLNLQRHPLNLPEPLLVLNENHPDYPDKSLGLWPIATLRPSLR